MRDERVYIAGKITGDTGYREKFKEAEQRLEKEYKWNWWCIVNPVREVPEKWPWWRQMLRCLRLLAGCKVVAMLPDWAQSRGARIEHEWAEFLGKEIIYINSLNKD